MKKIGIILALLVMISGFTACEKSKEENKSFQAETTSASETDKADKAELPLIDIQKDKTSENSQDRSSGENAQDSEPNESDSNSTTKKKDSENDSENDKTSPLGPIGSGMTLPEVEVY